LFLDRDGVLNEDRGYVHRVEDFVWLPGARETIGLGNRLGLFVFVVTNQSGVARGLYDEAAVRRLHEHMAADLARLGARVDAFRYCPHHPEASVAEYRLACACRKPAPGLLTSLAAEFPVDLARSVLIGDRPSDLAAAEAAGVKGVLFRGGDLRALAARALRDVGVEGGVAGGPSPALSASSPPRRGRR
jgi:D-glycero-D-manno-heptose 1,7-bisphosphate phosphatase